MSSANPKRVAILGFALETNRFAEPCGEHQFRERCLLYGDEITEDIKRPAPLLHRGIVGFTETMEAHLASRGAFEPVPIVFAAAERSRRHCSIAVS